MTKLEEDLSATESAKMIDDVRNREELNCADEREQSLERDLDSSHLHIVELEERLERMRSELQPTHTVSPHAEKTAILSFFACHL